MLSTQPPRPRSEQTRTPPAWRRHRGLLIALIVALVIRVLLWDHLPRTGLISDEGEYLASANWLAHGRGFAWYLGYLWTRAPLYPLFVAVHFWLFGDTVKPIYITQILLSLINVALVYFLAERLVTANDRRAERFSILSSAFSVPSLAALLMAIYFPFALYTQVLLSETLFLTLLLGGFLALAIWAEKSGGRRQEAGGRRQNQEARSQKLEARSQNSESRTNSSELKTQNSELRTDKLWAFVIRHSWLLAAGALFGLATLTRSLTLLFILIVALWVLVRRKTEDERRTTAPQKGRRSSFALRPWSCVAFSLAAALIILPWTVYNSTRLYGGLVLIDTSGAFNILLGGRTAYDGNRNDAATRDFVLVLLGQKKAADAAVPPCLPYSDRLPTTQAQRQAAMMREGQCLIAAKPRAYIQKSLAELVDLFQINPTGAERFANQFSSGRIPPWYALSLFLLDDTVYVLVLPLAVLGWALARKLQVADCRLQIGSTQQQSTIYNLQSAIGLWWLYNLAVAPLLFAINRFRLPLLPYAFIFAAYALAAMPRGWRALGTRYGGLCALLAALLFLIAATPYAYLEPRAAGAASRWASYLGPYPSSLAITRLVLDIRPSYLRAERFRAALQAGQLDSAQAILQIGDLATIRSDGIAADMRTLAGALLAGQAGQGSDALHKLPSIDTITAAKDVEAAVVLGDLLRRTGDLANARLIFSQTFVDDNNPVEWAWDWLRPPPLPNNYVDIAGNLDLGYISGCYLGEGDPEAQGNFRWCTDGARLRFPAAGTGTPQILALRADGRGWVGYAPTPPPVRVFVGDQPAGTFTPDMHEGREFTIVLPTTPKGTDVVVTLRSDTFIPGADRYLGQQGKAVVGQVQRLGVRLDWAELREP